MLLQRRSQALGLLGLEEAQDFRGFVWHSHGHAVPDLVPGFQARLCNNMQKARELWDSIMTRGNAKYANMWLEYYNLER